VEAIGPEHVVLIGHSIGGNVAVAAARILGTRVKAVVWVDTYRKLGSRGGTDNTRALQSEFQRHHFRICMRDVSGRRRRDAGATSSRAHGSRASRYRDLRT
jgi:thioesterase domain-containing protein